MGATLDSFWELIGKVFTLAPIAFRWARMQPLGEPAVLAIVLGAGLSEAIAQSIVLFVNRVRPARFILTLLIGAVLFVAGYFFLVLSTWLVSQTPFAKPLTLPEVANILGISYAPMLFTFLGAMPYLGVPIWWVLSFWHLLAMVIGFAEVTELTRWQASTYVLLGWIVLQVLERTIGQPLANFGSWLTNFVAGVELATRGRDLRELLRLDWKLQAFPSVPTKIDEPLAEAYGTQAPLLPRLAQRLLIFLAVGLLGALVIFLLSPLREWLLSWYSNLLFYERLAVDLLWIGIVTLVVAAIIAPLEALGWWAGWYGDRLDATTIHPGILTTPVVDGQAASRYVVYLDGIGQSNREHLPTVERFLDELEVILPDDIRVIKGIMPYSVMNNPLTGERPLAALWRLTERLRLQNRAFLLSVLVNLRNILVVAVSADQRYGPIYNRGVAQVIYNGLIYHGYDLNHPLPLTLIGYSGGGQISAAVAPFLRDALNAPIDIISLGGVISGSVNLLSVEHLYHLVGNKDSIERSGAVMFPQRWRIFPLSYWNRAKRRGKVSFISLGSVGHNVPGGLFDPDRTLDNGQTYLQQTLDWVARIIQGFWLPDSLGDRQLPSNYDLFRQADFVAPTAYPLDQVVDSTLYRPIAAWMGRLILPHLEERFQGVWFEVHHADVAYAHLVGKTVRLCWSDDLTVQMRVRATTQDLHFSEEAEYTQDQGLTHPTRINHWRQVNPLESLAGSHPTDDVVVMLPKSLEVREPEDGMTTLCIAQEPIQITGRFYALVQFVEPIPAKECFRVTHFNPQTREFDGASEVVRLPNVVPNQEGICFATSHEIERSPLNQTGWYIYGAKDATGMFVVQAIAPRALLSLNPNRVIRGSRSAYRYIKREAWASLVTQKGTIDSVLIASQRQRQRKNSEQKNVTQKALQQWKLGDRALLVHVYGGIGGNRAESAAKSPVYFGHFAYGIAEVVQDPLAHELRFEIVYHQVYTHNSDGIIAGSLHWTRYMGDRQFGWLGTRPVSDILIKLDAFTESFENDPQARSPLDLMQHQLEVMTARYRIGDGTGATYVGPANNCAQDSNQALYASLRGIENLISANQAPGKTEVAIDAQRFEHYHQLERLKRSLKQKLMPLGGQRTDWEKSALTLGNTLADAPMRNLIRGLGSWRTMLPRLASDTIVTLFYQQGATLWVLRTNQVGGWDPEIEPIAPITF
ncbi:MAG TPA: CAAX protease [Leptolyngbyaceae cyanobacterium M33_DOE_097]|uniref:CAAX protease n=1 Tax=Oscillatoriales cyanobacterium SpSt-418 TaxID=2282169 RepID=A0A7C3KBH0_9CYAN|nr:CAAX protease [Leptolyngbyaceae cyanobacterium M33_DOE_097]